MKKWMIVISIIFVLIVLITIIFINYSEGNNENISENNSYDIKVSNREIELALIRENENTVNNNETAENVSNEIFEEKVLDIECEKRKIFLDSEQEENLKNVIYNNPISDENKSKLEDMNMTEEEFRDYLYDRMIKMQKRVKLNKQLLEEINNNNIKIDNEEFKAEVKKFNDDKDNNTNTNTENLLNKCQELYNKYVDLISQQYNKIEE